MLNLQLQNIPYSRTYTGRPLYSEKLLYFTLHGEQASKVLLLYKGMPLYSEKQLYFTLHGEQASKVLFLYKGMSLYSEKLLYFTLHGEQASKVLFLYKGMPFKVHVLAQSSEQVPGVYRLLMHASLKCPSAHFLHL